MQQDQLVAHLMGSLATSLVEAEARVRTLKKLLEALPDNVNTQFRYKVILTSLWSDKGEEDVVHEEQGLLEQVMANAYAEFKKINNRTDVQASCRVFVALPNYPEDWLVVPEQFWRQYAVQS